MGKTSRFIEDTFARAAFAEQNVDPDSVFGPAKSEAVMQAKGKEKSGSVRQWLDDTGAAVAFAERGDHETATMIAKGKDAPKAEAQDESPLILVVGGKNSFSDELVNYAVEMAGRMHARILALTPAADADAACAEGFASACAAQDVAFSHMAKAGDRDRIVAQLSSEHPGLKYVMTEPATPSPQYKAIPVYRPAPSARQRDNRPTIRA